MTNHRLKTWQPYYSDIVRGLKKFDVRKDDRNFNVGDVLILEEYNPESQNLTGMVCEVIVTYKLPGGNFGIESGYCVLGIELFIDGPNFYDYNSFIARIMTIVDSEEKNRKN